MNTKLMYKLELLSVKYIPIFMSIIYTISMILSYLDININILDVLVGSSLITTIPMYISSYVFKFCKYHRMFIHHLVLVNTIDAIDLFIGIPVNDFNLLMIYVISFGIFTILALYYHQKYGGRSNE